MKPIETVDEAERRAKRRLLRAIFDSLAARTEKGEVEHDGKTRTWKQRT
jgi:hypothetical protein